MSDGWQVEARDPIPELEEGYTPATHLAVKVMESISPDTYQRLRDLLDDSV